MPAGRHRKSAPSTTDGRARWIPEVEKERNSIFEIHLARSFVVEGPPFRVLLEGRDVSECSIPLGKLNSRRNWCKKVFPAYFKCGASVTEHLIYNTGRLAGSAPGI